MHSKRSILKYIARVNAVAAIAFLVIFIPHRIIALQGILSQPTAPRTSASTAEEYAFVRIGLEQGLSQSSVYAITQDTKGFLWIGTQDGINKYDGYKFIASRSIENSMSFGNGLRGTLPSGWITQIVRDKFDNLWVSSNGGGLSHIQRDSNRATLMPLLTDARVLAPSANPHPVSVLRSGFVMALAADNRGRLWIGTDKGLHCIDTVKPSYTQAATAPIRYIPATLHDDSTRQALSGEITALVNDADGHLWIGTQHGFFCHTPDMTKKNSFTLEEIALPEAKKGKIAVQALFADSLGCVWIGTQGSGLVRYNPRTRQTRVFAYAPQRNDAPRRFNTLSGSNIFCFSTDERGFLWVGTDNGVNIISSNVHRMTDSADVEVVICRSVPQMPLSLGDNAVRSLYCDASGTMWVGTLTAGMSVWNPLRQRFGRYSPDIGNATFLPYRVVRSFYEESDSVLWVGTDDGLVRWNHRAKTYSQLPVVAKDGYGLQSGRVWTINRDSTGAFWFGTDGGGLHRYDPKKRTFTVFQHNPNDSSTLCNNRLRAATWDNNGCLWIGTLGGLDYFNPRTSTFTHFRHDPQNPQSMSHDRVQAVFCDVDSTVWIGTSFGLNRFDPKRNRWKRYFHDSTVTSLPNNWVKHIMRDSDGILWLATVSGFCRYNPAQDNFTVYGLQHGLTNEYMYGIVEDAKGFLWMGTDKGLARFDKQSGTFRMYETADGLQSNEFNTNAFYRTSQGYLLFGGVNGMNMFRPDMLTARTFAPTVVLTAVKVFNTERMFDTDVAELRELILSHNDRLIELNFAALDFANIERVQYAYMMEGIDKEFVSFGTRNFATYTNLPAGEYTFRVRATNADGVWNARELHLRLVVIPPFWETWWFRSGIILFLCGLAFGGVQMRLRGIAKRNSLLQEEVRKRTQELQESNQELAWSNERLHELNKEKNAILGITAHDLKTPLATVLTLTELVENDHNTLSREELYHFTSLIHQSANRMMALIKQLLNMNMIDEGKLNLSVEIIEVNHLITKLIADVESLARPKNLVILFEEPALTYFVGADPNAYMQIIENLLSNALKYSPLGKRIWVELGTMQFEDGEYVCCCVRDEGNGLTDDDKKRLFGKFARLSARPTGGEHSTGLGLSIVKKLVEAMNGKIWCESEHRRGAAFSVAFPRIQTFSPISEAPPL